MKVIGRKTTRIQMKTDIYLLLDTSQSYLMVENTSRRKIRVETWVILEEPGLSITEIFTMKLKILN